jgi:hypothetical protein
MKKTTKPVKAPAPATKRTAPAPALKSAIAPKIKRTTAASTPSIVTKPKGGKVKIVAKIDVGFGNALFVRGDGAGLSWEKGRGLDYSGDAWVLVLSGVEEPFEFKFLVNDLSWSSDSNYCASPGDTLTLVPVF